MRAFNLLTLLISGILLASCSSKEGKLAPSDPSNQATFVVDQLELAAVQDTKTDTIYSSLATEKQISFRACIRDVALLESVIGQEFRISSPERQIDTKKTDQRGCITWTENYPVNSLADETYIQTERTIEAISFHKGSQKVAIAINPQSKSDAIIDMRYRTPPKITKSNQQMSTFADNALFIENASVEIQINQTSANAASGVMRLKMQPKIRRVGLDGRKIHEALQQGRFRIQTQILANNNSRLSPVSKSTDNNVDFTDGQIFFETPIQLTEIPNERTVELALNIEAINAPVPLGKQTSLLTIGRINRVLTNAGGDLRPIQMSTAKLDVDINNLNSPGNVAIASIDDSKPATTSSSGNNRNMSVNMDKITVTKVYPMNISPSTGKPNRLRIELKAKVSNGISNEGIINQRFSIDELGEKRYVADSDAEGYLHWAVVLDFSSIANERYFKKSFKFKIEDEFYADAEIERTVEINPWQYDGSPDLLLVDTKFNQSPSIPQNLGLPEILLNRADFEFKKRDFDIDNKLNFSVIRKFEFKLRPRIKRLTATGWREESIGNGKYNVKFMLELQGHNPIPTKDAYIFSKTVEALNDGEELSALVDIPFDYLPNVVNRNLLSIEIVPVGNHTRFAPKSFSGDFIAIQEKGATALSPKMTPILDAGLSEQRRAAYARISAVDPIKLFLSRFKMESVSNADLISKWKVSESEKAALITNPTQSPNILAKFCAKYFSADSLVKCQKSPGTYLDSLTTEHVQKINSKPELQATDVINITISTAFTFSESENRDSSEGSSVRKEVDSSSRGSLLPQLSPVSAGVSVSIGKAWYNASSKSRGRSHSAGTQINAGKTINADELIFRINATVNRCVVVSAKIAANVAGSPAGIHICESKPIVKTIIEKYFYVYLFFRAATSPVVDASSDPIERPWTVLIRGEKRFDSFRKALEDSSGYIHMTKSIHTPGSVLNSAESKFDGLFPGLVTIE